ncbi:ribonucleotide reductase subunit alpha [Methylococcaceae bacterium HT1]|nr:ribonucleotide reductase subunit alpha [Methylococcaceae bacterium HT1]TXL16751.1 ribonucleotide reductase subunit alpha [Methylococcaceae bacterium HT3]TXL21679.1 ribonucleotide reductase subunit alpha [Methylococcaceae bacterium HT2]
MIEITDYQSLLAVGRQQQDPQRFLFVFLQVSLPTDHDDADKQKFHSGQGGELQAIMCIDKDLAELTNFADLVTESEQMEQDWSMVLIACLSGNNGTVPGPDDAEQPLKMMVQTVQSGGDLSKYLAFDKQGDLLHFS